MSALDTRADHLYEGLTACERAILELEATKSDETPSVLIRWTMPDSQTAEFNGYMRQLRVMSRVFVSSGRTASCSLVRSRTCRPNWCC